MRNRWLAASGAAAAVVFLAACGSSAASGTGGAAPASSAPASSSAAGGSASSNSGAGIKTASVSGGTVLTTAQGFTIYWFAIDKPNKSNCTSSECVTFWPPVTGQASAASGVSLPGKLGSFTRSDGTTQATYNGHPLYTYKGDTAAGQVNGNGLNISGGLWYALTPSGAKLTGQPASSPTSSGGGGYGY